VVKKRSGPHECYIRETDITENGVEIGPPLEKFQGILTGTPRYFANGGNGDNTSPELARSADGR